jgi:predicted amidohydrolase YtcJ
MTGLLARGQTAATEQAPGAAAGAAQVSPITLFVADELITMSDSLGRDLDAVAVQDGKILDVGNRKSLEEKYAGLPGFTVNDVYENQVISAGFVEPHLHLWLGGILMGTEFITPADWSFPDGESRGVQSRDAYMARLRELEASHPEGRPLVTWGYHHYFHGKEMSRSVLDGISTERPIIVWHRSFHELYFNTAALSMFGWDEEFFSGDTPAHQQMVWEKGHVFEAGGKLVLPDVLALLLEEGIFARGLARMKRYVHSGGITTAVDPGVFVTPEMYRQMVGILTKTELPMQYWMMPAGNVTYAAGGSDAEKGKQIADAQTAQFAGTGRIQWLPKYIKLFADGAMYSQLMQLKGGYLDGHHGEWIQRPEELEDSMRPYWKDDYTIVIHANGDRGFEVAIDIVNKLNDEYQRDDHRTSFHHLGITEGSDIQRAVKQGSNFSVNPYYTHILAENYVVNGIGKERAEVMSRGRSIIDAGGILSLHSDALMAPAEPLRLVWAAVNRVGLSGDTVIGESERITVEEALRGVTINAAYVVRLEDSIGSIDIGKAANFTVLDKSPFEVPPLAIKDIAVEATIFEGRVYPVD